jgi:hypothetical protein
MPRVTFSMILGTFTISREHQYNVLLLICVTETIHNKNPVDAALAPLGNFSNLHKIKMVAIYQLCML